MLNVSVEPKREFESLNIQESETISKYADQISLFLIGVRLLNEEFTEKINRGEYSCDSS